MRALPEIVQAEFDRLMATPPLMTADLSVSVADILKHTSDDAQYRELCAKGVSSALICLGLTRRSRQKISVAQALDAGIGLDDVLRAIDACHPDGQRILRLFAADCAEMALPLFEQQYPSDKRPRAAIEAARGYALGSVAAEELTAAREAAGDAARAAWAAAGDAAGEATWAAAGDAARAAWEATWAAAGAAFAQLLRRYHAEGQGDAL